MLFLVNFLCVVSFVRNLRFVMVLVSFVLFSVWCILVKVILCVVLWVINFVIIGL